MVILIVVLVVVLSGGDDEPTTAPGAAIGTTGVRPQPIAATPTSLAELSTTLKRPLYWVGPSQGRTYELTQTTDGSVYVRYLRAGVSIGDARPDFLTVGTYPQSDPFDTVEDASKRAGAQIEELDDGGLAVANRSRPNSWYVAYPDAEELVEVYSPEPERARELVRDERVVPVEG